MSRITFDAATIEALAAAAQHWGLTEIEMRDGDTHLRITRAPPVVVAAPAPVPASPLAATLVAAVEPVEEGPPEGAVPSPMVGIAYLAAEPGSPPFIALGQAVTQGQTLLLIEAMKTFNQVKAPKSGTITRILVASGQPVEYGQPLVVIT